MTRFTKSIVKSFKTGFARFIAIIAIIALGVGFMIGISQSTPDIKNSMDVYFEGSNAYDIDIKGTYGLSRDDIEKIAEVKFAGQSAVEYIMPYVSTDAVAYVSLSGVRQSVTTRIMGVDFDVLQGDGGINKLTLEEGRLPENKAECVIQRPTNRFKSIPLGSIIQIDASTATYGDVFDGDTLTVVGIVSSPEYYYFDAREVTTVGTGVVGCVAYTWDYFYDLSKSSSLANLSSLGVEPVYTDAAIILNGSDKYTVFTDEYENYIKDRVSAFSDLGLELNESINEGISSINDMLSRLGSEESIPLASWYTLDISSSNYSYVGLRMNADKVNDIAGIFPIFFIVVAALVALTSMSRMIEKERVEIGTFKALGYSNLRIVSKYLIYCGVASVIGCAIGGALGFSILPIVIWKAYGVLYYLPKLVLSFSPVYFVIVLLVALAVTVLVTLYSSRSTILEKPASMMMPKAPAPGKRILLERCTPVWKHLKFSQKATIRNIFRYKRNMLLTIISVMGCTALIFAGFGCGHTISNTINVHFDELQRYDLLVSTDSVSAEFSAFLDENESYNLFSEDGTVNIQSDKSGLQSVKLYALTYDEQARPLSDFMDTTDALTGEQFVLGEGEAAIGYNYYKYYGMSLGDVVSYSRTDGTDVDFTITHVFGNYVGGALLCSYDYFAKSVGLDSASYAPKSYLINLSGGFLAGIDEDYDDISVYLTEVLFSFDGVSSVTFSSDTRAVYAGLDSIMGYITILLVVCAGLLAAIVLYNLTNINIEERNKEIATLKVLGYTQKEVAGYIYRESAVLTIIGALLGLALGALVVWYVTYRLNNAALYFSFFVQWWVYPVAFLLTLAFAAIVYAFMTIKLNKTDMADSLKSNE